MEYRSDDQNGDDPATIPVERLIQSVESVLDRLSKSSSSKRSKHPRCHTILCHGRNGSRLRLFEVIFAQRISLRYRQDVHLLRSSHLPDLLHKSLIPKLITDRKGAHYLSFLKIYYFNDYSDIVKRLSSISVSNRCQMLPAAFIIDGVSAYMRTETEDAPDPDEGAKRFRRAINRTEQEEQILMRLCSLLLETMEYCAVKLNCHTHLVLCLDLNQHSDLALPQSDQLPSPSSLVAKLTRRYFRESINVDII